MSKYFFKYDCEHFSGFKPCHNQSKCHECKDYIVKKPKCLIINYDALGDVLRTSIVAKVLAETYDIFWVTSERAKELIVRNPYIKKIFTDSDSRIFLNMEFDLSINFDKSHSAGFLLKQVKSKNKQGFYIDENLSIRYVGKNFEELYITGLFDDLKFKKNTKSMNQLLIESIGEKFSKKMCYDIYFSKSELAQVEFRKKSWKKNNDLPLIGVNVGCSKKYPLKKLSLNLLETLCLDLQARYQIVLLGGVEDAERLESLTKKNQYLVAPYKDGLRDGAISIAACDLIITGDSLALHLAIATQTKVVVWFGLSCGSEIELYNRGEKVFAPVTCGPCWKQTCNIKVKCNELVRTNEILNSISRLTDSEIPSIEKDNSNLVS